MNPEIKLKEQEHLKSVLEKVNKAKKKIEGNLQSLGKDNLDRLIELREDGADSMDSDFHFFMEQLHEKNSTLNVKGNVQKLDELQYLSKEPYFSRIDLHNDETGENKEIYIGKFGYTDNVPVVTDWRTKIASVYYRYRYPQKDVFYDTPEGIKRWDLDLKRTYEIHNGQLIKFYNNDIQLDESQVIKDKLEKRTGGVLEDIVETIQASQLDIIESDPRQVCIVQGCVGSGKSTVAIHKLAHIFFNYPKIIRAENSILVAKNQILVGYLSTLFPKLGIFDVRYKTLRELIVNLIFREKIKINIDLDSEQDTSNINSKTINDIKQSVEKAHESIESRINDLFLDDEYACFGGFKYSNNYTPFENLSDLISDLEEELNNQKNLLKEHRDSPQEWLWKENVKILRRLIKNLADTRRVLTEKTLTNVCKEFGINPTKTLSYRDSLVYLTLYLYVIGINKFRKYEYCVVDEGQDFSLIEYMFLNKLVLRGRFSIFGDLNQSLENDGIKHWNEIPEVIEDAKNAVTFELDTNYRSTKPIIDLARSLLDTYTKNYLPKSINRVGKEPEIQYFNTSDEILENIKEELREEIKNIDKSIGIICFDKGLMDNLNNFIQDQIEDKTKLIVLKPENTIHYIPKGVYIMDSDNCKGLEFSKVYIVGLNLDKIKNFSDARKAFVGVTRAMNELKIVGLK